MRLNDRTWPFFREIVAAGETFSYDRDLTEAQGRPIWMVGPPGRTVVAAAPGGTVLGSANMYANKGGARVPRGERELHGRSRRRRPGGRAGLGQGFVGLHIMFQRL